MHACQKRKGERACMIPSEFEPAVSMMELYKNMFVNLILITVKKVSRFSDITGNRRLLRALRLLSEWMGVVHRGHCIFLGSDCSSLVVHMNRWEELLKVWISDHRINKKCVQNIGREIETD